MAFMGILLLGLGFLAFVIAIICFEVAAIFISAIFLALAIVMFVIAKKRKNAGKRQTPFIPIAITSTVISGSLDAVWITFLVIFLVFINTPPVGYVAAAKIDETGDISESFHVNGVEYKMFEPCGSIFNNVALNSATEAVFSYCPSSKLNWTNFYKVPGAGKEHQFDLVKSNTHICYVRANQFKEANNYYNEDPTDNETIFFVTKFMSDTAIKPEYFEYIRNHFDELKYKNYSSDQAVKLQNVDTFNNYVIKATTSDHYFDKSYINIVPHKGYWYLESDAGYFLLSPEFQNILNDTEEIK